MMADIMNTIMNRRSIRRYQDKEIPDNILNKVLEAARRAPSWANSQAWEIVVVKEQSIKE